jgi:hypothetical protein
MTEHERKILLALCARIVDEKNSAVFVELLIELEALLEGMNNHHARHAWLERANVVN